MKKTALSCLFMVCVYLSFAQLPITDVRYPDSLLKLLATTKSDSVKARSLFLLSDYWSNSDTLKSKNFLAKGLKYGDKYPYVKALYYYYLGGYYFSTNGSKSETNYLEADKQLSKFSSKEAFLFRSKCWSKYAILEFSIKDNSITSIDIFINKVIPLVKKTGNVQHLAVNYHNIAMIFMDCQQYDKAAEYLQLSISLLEKQPTVYINELYQNHISLSRNYLFQNSTLPAKKELGKAKAFLVKTTSPINYMKFYVVEGTYYTAVKAYGKALQALKKGEALAVQSKEYNMERNLSLEMYRLFTKQKAYQKALAVLRKNVEGLVIHKHSSDDLIYYLELSETYSKLGNSKMAYTWLKKYSKLKDSINAQEVEQKISALEVKFKTAEKEKKIIALNAENEKANLSAKNSKLLSWLFGIACLFLLIVAILGWLFYRSSKKLTIQKDLNHRQQIEDFDRKQKIKIVQAMLNAKEEEQNRIACDLHDGLGGTLAGIKINLSHYASKNKNNDDAELYQIMDQMEGSINELRRIAHDTMPEMLLKFGLEESLRGLCASLTSEKLNIDFKYLGAKHAFLPQQQISIYRIIQEAMHNAVKHAEAKNILLQCSQNDNIFYITIEDDGKGFDPAYLTKGMGIQNIKNRVAYLDGEMEILSAENKPGTSINIELNVTA
ncbi:tetratricopeptide repeat-containing sensor histidine kinase [Pedobacter kyonggii]|uniref:histidine kinase n=1 Tax=Pedobacter kyonggii TaxID=1926871 RepID=A0A4Q9HF07_9SPHI|nr:sensor histidine kinase [Pedobacter kyonggii]TBO43502.1 sensor histidine kinase [Pedobacter kyonggii]